MVTRAAKQKPGPKPVSATPARGCFEKSWADRLCKRLVNSAHPKQRLAVEDLGLFVAMLCARGAGKTAAVIFRILIKMIRIPRARCVYIATTRDAARELIWEDLKDIVERLGIGPDTGEVRFNETRMSMTFTRNGSYFRLYGADDTAEVDKLRGRSFHEAAIDEAASHTVKILEWLIERVIGPRLGDKSGVITLVGTPGHLLQGIFFEATRDDSTRGCPYERRLEPEFAELAASAMWSTHFWDLEDAAPYVPAIARLWERALFNKSKNGWSDDHPVWLREYKRRWAQDDTINVYKFKPYADDGSMWNMWNVWDPKRVGPHQIAELPKESGGVVLDPKGWLFALGADMGSADPFALHGGAAHPKDPLRQILHVFEYESPADSKMYAKRIAEILFGPDDGSKPWPNHKKPGGLIGAIGWPSGAMADMAHLGEAILEELANVYGFRFEKLPNGRGDKESAIELTNGDYIDGRMKLMKGSKLEKQASTLQWSVDAFGKVTENKAQSNHSTDAWLGVRAKLANVFEQMPTSTPRPSVLGPRPPVRTPDRDEPVHERGEDSLGDGFSDGFDESWGNF